LSVRISSRLVGLRAITGVLAFAAVVEIGTGVATYEGISGESGLLLWPAVALPLTWFCGRKLVTAARP
jgi:hypothetical protein